MSDLDLLKSVETLLAGFVLAEETTMDMYEIERPGRNVEKISPFGEIKLGESGRGRSLVVINIIDDGGENYAVFGNELLKTTLPKSKSCLVRVNTTDSYQRGRRYDLLDAENCEQIIASGHFAFGDAGRVGGGEDYLIEAVPGTAFTLREKYGKETRYHWDGAEWLVGSLADVKMALAKPAIEKINPSNFNLSQIPDEILKVFETDMSKLSYKRSSRDALKRWAKTKGIGENLFIIIEQSLKRKLVAEGWHFNW